MLRRNPGARVATSRTWSQKNTMNPFEPLHKLVHADEAAPDSFLGEAQRGFTRRHQRRHGPAGKRRHAVFLDRDGVLNEDRGCVIRPEDFHWLPGAIAALQELQQAGWHLVVVSNQPGIARGIYGPAEYDTLTSWMTADLARHGVALDGVYHCPHLPDAPLAAWRRQCECHKPAPGLLRRAARDHKLDLASSVMIGDNAADIGAGRAAGVAACVLVDGSHRFGASFAPPPDFTCGSLLEAADWLLAHQRELRA
jgi:D-glycero-D-manno-heptose 1,7-bisphosphate phosphatase